MIKYLKILAYLITVLARKGNPRIKYDYLGDSIGWGFLLINLWLVIVFYDLFIESVFPGFVDKYTNGKILNPYVVTAAFMMILEFFIFFSKDQWRQFIPEFEQMEWKKRRILCWRVILFLIVTFPISIILLVIKYPLLITWTG